MLNEEDFIARLIQLREEHIKQIEARLKSIGVDKETIVKTISILDEKTAIIFETINTVIESLPSSLKVPFMDYVAKTLALLTESQLDAETSPNDNEPKINLFSNLD